MEIRNQLMSIWKDTFHDSDEYINIVFDNYYNEDSCFYKILDGKIVSSMLCVTYVVKNTKRNISNGENDINIDSLSIDGAELFNDVYTINNNKYNNELCDIITENEVFLKENSSEFLKSSYLKCAYQCGLATIPKYRNRGIMSELIHKSNYELFRDGFAISLLIPSNEHNILYYKKSDYIPVTYINTNVYLNEHNFIPNLQLKKCDYFKYNVILNNTVSYVIYNISEYYMLLKKCLKDDNTSFIDKEFNTSKDDDTIDFSASSYSNYDAVNKFRIKFYLWYKELSEYITDCRVVHTYKDFCAILEENFVSCGKILFLTDNNSKPLGMLFCCNIEEDEVTLQLLVSASEETDKLLLQSLKSFIPKSAKIILRRYPTQPLLQAERSQEALNGSNECDASPSRLDYSNGLLSGNNQIYVPYTIAPDNDGYVHNVTRQVTEVASASTLQKSYAMAKILNVAEVLKFVASLNKDAEFSILIDHDEFSENEGLFMVKGGRLSVTPLSQMSLERYNTIIHNCQTKLDWFNISVLELSEILFRRSSKLSVVDEAISIPRLLINVALMLD